MAAPMPTAYSTQPTVVLATPAPGSNTQQQTYKSKLRGLAIAEVVLGVACVILGAIVTGIIGEEISSFRSFLDNYYYRGSNSYRYGGNSNNLRYIDSYNSRYGTLVDYRYYSLFTIGEGIWCGIWIILAGATGIHAAKAKSSRCMVNTHLAFSIVSCVASAALVAIGGYAARRNDFLIHGVALYSLLVIVGFTSFVLNIISASFCCTTLGCCMMNQAYGYGGQVTYTQPLGAVVGTNGIVYTQQPPIQYQGVPNVQQGVVGLVQQQPMAQSMTPGSMVFAPPTTTVQPNQVSTGTTVTAAEPQNGEDSGARNFPPSYNISPNEQ